MSEKVLLDRLKSLGRKYYAVTAKALSETTKEEGPGAEASACCRVIRLICRELLESESGSPVHGPAKMSESIELASYLEPYFSCLDHRQAEALTWADMNEFLKLIGLSECSDEAFRLIMLSFGTLNDTS
jgi:hypothetical protein